MASQQDIGATYDWMTALFIKALGDFPAISCRRFDGDASLTIEEATARTNEYVARQIGLRPGMSILDVGCGWGPSLKAIQDRGAQGMGLTLSPAQAAYCRRKGLDAHLQDWRSYRPDKRFDGVVSIGAFEHFCSIEEYVAGRQRDIYRAFFRLCKTVLPEQGRLFLQTMVWNPAKLAEPGDITLDAPTGSDLHLMALLRSFYPGSWPPVGKEQIVECAEAEGLGLVRAESGRLDYITTIDAWRKRTEAFRPSLLWEKARLIPRYVREAEFRRQIASFRHSANQEMFKRHIFDHFRLTFEK